MPERIDLDRQQDRDVPERVEPGQHCRQKDPNGLGVQFDRCIRVGDLWQRRDLRKQVTDLALRGAENARILSIALTHERDTNRAAGELQGGDV